MTVGAQALACGLLPIVREAFLGQAAFQIGACVHARRGVRLEIDQVAALPGAEEMVEADLEQIRRRGVARDMAAELRVGAVRAHHHGKRVPAHHRRDAALELGVAGELRLLGERDRVLVGRVQHRRQRHAARPGVVEELPQQERGTLAAFGLHQRVEGVEPLAGFLGIRVRRIHAPESGSDDVGEVGHGGMLCPPAACRPTGPSTVAGRVLYSPRSDSKAANLHPEPATCGPQWQSNHFLDRHARLRRARNRRGISKEVEKWQLAL